MTNDRGERVSKEALLGFAKGFPFFKLLGLEVVDIKPGWSKTQIRYRSDLCQPAGILHGGVIATLIDTGIAQALLLTDLYQEAIRQGGSIVSVDLRVKYLRPVTEGLIVCESTVPKLGRRIVHAESVVVNAAGKEVARGDAIYTTATPNASGPS